MSDLDILHESIAKAIASSITPEDMYTEVTNMLDSYKKSGYEYRYRRNISDLKDITKWLKFVDHKVFKDTYIIIGLLEDIVRDYEDTSLDYSLLSPGQVRDLAAIDKLHFERDNILHDIEALRIRLARIEVEAILEHKKVWASIIHEHELDPRYEYKIKQGEKLTIERIEEVKDHA